MFGSSDVNFTWQFAATQSLALAVDLKMQVLCGLLMSVTFQDIQITKKCRG
jgi:hypothetical protein